MTLLFRVVALLYLGFTAVGPLFGILPWWTGNSVWYHLPKVFFLPTMLVLGTHWVLSRRRHVGYLGMYLIAYGSVVIAFGLVLNGPNLATVSHVQALLLPVFGISFGFAAIRSHPCFSEMIERWTPLVGAVLLGLIGLYYLLVNRGVVVYFGVSTLIALPFACALARNRIDLAVLFFSAAILTGKRVSIVGLGVLFLLYLLQRRGDRPVAVLVTFVALVVGLATWGPALADAYVLRRLSFLWTTGETIDLNLATAGRVGEATAMIQELVRTPSAWIMGFGAGATFIWSGPSGASLTAHYAHFSPLSYVFLGGVLLMVPIYWTLLRHFVWYSRRAEGWYEWMFLYYFVASFSGAILFSDPFAWIVTGMAIASYRSFSRPMSPSPGPD